METKREFLKKLGLITVGSMVGGTISKASASPDTVTNLAAKKKNIGLQLYSLSNELTDDVPAGLKKVVKIGYNTAEAAGYSNGKIYNYEMNEFRKIADDAGLKITGTHVNPPVSKYSKDNAGEIAEFWKKAIDDNLKCGIKTIVQPGMPSIESKDDAKMVGEVFNRAGEIAKAAGIRWGYHNHNREFGRINGSNGRQSDVVYDLMLTNTDPNLVFFEMDVYWTVMGQSDPVEYFEKYAGRFPILHIKDRAVLGKSGMMNFESIFKKAYENGLDEYYVEIEGIGNRGMTQFEGVKQCYDYLNKASFVV